MRQRWSEEKRSYSHCADSSSSSRSSSSTSIWHRSSRHSISSSSSLAVAAIPPIDAAAPVHTIPAAPLDAAAATATATFNHHFESVTMRSVSVLHPSGNIQTWMWFCVFFSFLSGLSSIQPTHQGCSVFFLQQPALHGPPVRVGAFQRR